MHELCDLKVHINGLHTFLLNQSILCKFSGRLRKLVKHERKRSQTRGSELKLIDFPGGPEGFELVSRFCYNNGRITLTPSNISFLHCSATYLEMTEEASISNLLSKTEDFLVDLHYWPWHEVLTALKSCEQCFSIADSYGLLHRLISSLLAKISDNIYRPLTPLPSFSSISSSPESFGLGSTSSTKATDIIKPSFREWWFDDLTVLAPNIMEKIIRILGAYGTDNQSLILTRFILHYLQRAAQWPSCSRLEGYGSEVGGLADTAVHGVLVVGKAAFSCRGLFWVLRVVKNLGLSRESRHKLERLMGLMLDQATLDDLLVSGQDGAVYDVSLVLRLVDVFVSAEEGVVSLQKLRKVGRLIDNYLGEISPDQSLKVSKFLAAAECLPHHARECFDGVYRAVDIYLESHPMLSSEERTRVCQCLNYEKLSLEACKDLAKNPRIPPRITVQALASQQTELQMMKRGMVSTSSNSLTETLGGVHCSTGYSDSQRNSMELCEDRDELRLSVQRMQWRVVELEKECREMKGQMSRFAKSSKSNHNGGRRKHWLC